MRHSSLAQLLFCSSHISVTIISSQRRTQETRVSKWNTLKFVRCYLIAVISMVKKSFFAACGLLDPKNDKVSNLIDVERSGTDQRQWPLCFLLNISVFVDRKTESDGTLMPIKQSDIHVVHLVPSQNTAVIRQVVSCRRVPVQLKSSTHPLTAYILSTILLPDTDYSFIGKFNTFFC